MIIAINPRPFIKGVQIKSVEQGSVAYEQGITEGEIIEQVNGKVINTLADYQEEINKLIITPQRVNVITDKGNFSYDILDDIEFRIDENLTVIGTTSEIEKDSKLYEINGIKINSINDFDKILNDLIKKNRLEIKTDKNDYVFLVAGDPKIQVGVAETTNIKKGLDLQGGTRVLLKPEAETGEVDSKQISDLIKVLSNRLDVYGLKDLKIRSATDLNGDKFVLVEIAGVSKEEVKDLIEKQGKFEAKIGEDIVFLGGRDIKFVCREDGTCSGIRQCNQISSDQWGCNFEFRITLSPEAAKRQAEITKNLYVNVSNSGNRYLSKTLDLYLDNKKLDSLQISEDLKGKETTDILISGPGFGRTELEAYNDALFSMDKLQTILITGSLPLKLNIVKLDTISPILGQQFIKSSFIIGIVAMIGVALVIYVRYKKFKIIIPMMMTVAIEILLTLGVAALIKWNLDVASIAGIIVAVGTGVNDQIVITDEVLKGNLQTRYYNWKEKIKRAMFIVFSAYAAILAAMFPLFFAGAGLIRGFAVTTIIGVSVGVLFTRPAYASIVENLLEE
jgi:preprotein translocase subunit SecD